MRNRFLLIAGILIVLIGGSVAIILLVNRSPKLQNVVYKIANTNAPVTNTATTNTAANRSQTPTDQEAIRFAARTFTEMYGSFSNQNAGSNLVEAAAYASPSFAQSLRQQAVVVQAKPPETTYQQTITKALVFTTIKQSLQSASLVVTTQQQLTAGSATSTVTKDLLLDLEKRQGAWQVSAAVWK